MSITALLAISLGAILTNNFIFAQFLGICPFLGVSKKIDTAVGMGAAVTFVMGLASAVCFGVNKILVAMGLGYMQTVAFILVIAGLVQFVEMFLKKNIPTLYTAHPAGDARSGGNRQRIIARKGSPGIFSARKAVFCSFPNVFAFTGVFPGRAVWYDTGETSWGMGP